MNRKVMDLWVGVFVAISFAALLFLALKVSNFSASSFASTYQLTARFENIGGLKVRGPVKSAGVVVGRVSEIRFDPETYEANVMLNIDSRYQFPKDTFASILTSGLLGEQYIGLTPGFSDEEMGTTVLKSGDRIEDTKSAIVLEELIGKFLYSQSNK